MSETLRPDTWEGSPSEWVCPVCEALNAPDSLLCSCGYVRDLDDLENDDLPEADTPYEP
jgi:hypothetical protein